MNIKQFIEDNKEKLISGHTGICFVANEYHVPVSKLEAYMEGKVVVDRVLPDEAFRSASNYLLEKGLVYHETEIIDIFEAMIATQEGE